MNLDLEFRKLMHHSVLVTWDGVKEKWQAECLALNIRIEAELYQQVIDDLIHALSNADPDLVKIAEDRKYPHF